MKHMPVKVTGDSEADKACADYANTLAAAAASIDLFGAAISQRRRRLEALAERDEAIAALARLLVGFSPEHDNDPEIKRCRAIVARYGK